MSKVLAGITISLDGYVTGANDGPGVGHDVVDGWGDDPGFGVRVNPD